MKKKLKVLLKMVFIYDLTTLYLYIASLNCLGLFGVEDRKIIGWISIWKDTYSNFKRVFKKVV